MRTTPSLWKLSTCSFVIRLCIFKTPINFTYIYNNIKNYRKSGGAGAFRQKRLGISFLDILSVGKKLLSEGEPSVNQSRLPEELDYKLKFRIQNR